MGLTAEKPECAEGGIASFDGCTFEDNQAIAKTAYGNEVPDTSINGGAMYISRKSTLSLNDFITPCSTATKYWMQKKAVVVRLLFTVPEYLLMVLNLRITIRSVMVLRCTVLTRILKRMKLFTPKFS